MMDILSEIVRINLQRLLGPEAQIEDVQIEDGFVQFSLPTAARFECPMGVHLTIYGIVDDSVQCIIHVDDFDSQLRLRAAMKLGGVLKN